MKKVDKVIDGIEFGKVTFSYLRKLDDSCNIIFRGVIIKEENISEMKDFVHKIGISEERAKEDLSQMAIPEQCQSYGLLIHPDKNLTGVYFICDNVKGDAGRSNYLLTFDRPDLQFNPMVRLVLHHDFTWVSDFVSNYKTYYRSSRSGDADKEFLTNLIDHPEYFITP